MAFVVDLVEYGDMDGMSTYGDTTAVSPYADICLRRHVASGSASSNRPASWPVMNRPTLHRSARIHRLRTAAAVTATGALLLAGLPAAASGAGPTAQTDTAQTDAEQAPAAPPSSTPASNAAQVDAPVPDIVWQPCEDAEGFECATIDVPTDYDRPHGRTTTIAVTRLPATAPDAKIGSVLTNFGGPGGPGVENLHAVGEVMVEPEVREQFDLVSFDPRGVGESDPVTCFRDETREQEYLATLPDIPLTRAEDRRAVAGYARIAAGCQLWSGQRLASGSTANVARDMDLLRQALGDERLTYLGYSYGTILGATYSALFPDRVRALVLDGTIDPVAWSGEGSDESIAGRIGQAEAGTETFAEFNRLCTDAGPAGCPLAALGDPAEITENVFTALREDGPVDIPAGDGTTATVTYGQMVASAFNALYAPAQWVDLSIAFGQVALAAGVVDSPVAPRGRLPQRDLGELLRELTGAEDYTSVGSPLAAQCMDTHEPLRLWQFPAYADDLHAQYPHFGQLRGWTGAGCAPMLVRDEDAYTGPWEQTTEEPVMVIGTRYDPATPYEFTAPYAAHYDDARVLSVEGWGHTTLIAPSRCADAAVARYLIDVEADDGATCAPDAVPFAPSTRQSDAAEQRLEVARSMW